MKLNTFLAGGLLLITTSAMADPFSGAYVGAGAQWLNLRVKSHYTDQTFNLYLPNTNASKVVGNFFLGYGQRVDNNYYLGAELGYMTNSKASYSQMTIFSPYVLAQTVKLTNQFNAGLKLGGFITPNTLLYLHPALAYARINPTFSIIGVSGPRASNTPGIWGAQIGLGVDYAFTEHFIAQVETDYIDYKSVTTVTPVNTQSVQTHFDTNSFSVGLSGLYKF